MVCVNHEGKGNRKRQRTKIERMKGGGDGRAVWARFFLARSLTRALNKKYEVLRYTTGVAFYLLVAGVLDLVNLTLPFHFAQGVVQK